MTNTTNTQATEEAKSAYEQAMAQYEASLPKVPIGWNPDRNSIMASVPEYALEAPGNAQSRPESLLQYRKGPLAMEA